MNGAETVTSWIDDSELHTIASTTYWNDEEKEKDKAYYITGNNAEKLWAFLREGTTYYDQYVSAVRMSSRLGASLKGVGVDVAAGVCWTTALLSLMPEVAKVYALDISKHRLTELAPNVCAAFGAKNEKIVRVLGSFYDIRLPDASVDFCLMAQAFHHAEQPQRLLEELRRIMKPGSPALMIGEEPIYPLPLFSKRLKNAAKMVVPGRHYVTPAVWQLLPRFEDLYPADAETGDHYYRIGDYFKIFKSAGFVLHAARDRRFTVFTAIRRP
jgi:ubiquinone/menaquinone biosynthesis C-methylase UbiE